MVLASDLLQDYELGDLAQIWGLAGLGNSGSGSGSFVLSWISVVSIYSFTHIASSSRESDNGNQ